MKNSYRRSGRAPLVLIGLCTHLSCAPGSKPQPAPSPPLDNVAPADTASAEAPDTEVNLLVVVGRNIDWHEVPHKGDDIPFDTEYALTVEVLEVVFGSYRGETLSFSAYIHAGPPPFKDDEYGMVYVSRYDGRYVQQRNIFQTLYPTADGRWAGCGDPYRDMDDMHRHGVVPEPIAFAPPVTFDTSNMSQAAIDKHYPAPFFRRESGKAVCLMGNYPEEMFLVMKQGYLHFRDIFDHVLQ